MAMIWDEPKRETNLRFHHLDFADARDHFEWDTALVLPSYSGVRGGQRFIAVGLLKGALVTLVFSPLGSEAISAISLRPASNRERKRYAQS
jgi:uncharacterized DUF497 family protein